MKTQTTHFKNPGTIKNVLLFTAILVTMLLASAIAGAHPSYRKLHKWEMKRDTRLTELVESYYITLENPENNARGEQDSLLHLIKVRVRKLKK